MNQKPTDTATLTISFKIEPIALDILNHQAAWQGLTMDEMIAYYTARVAGVMEEQHGNHTEGQPSLHPEREEQ